MRKNIDSNELDLFNYSKQVKLVDESIAKEWIREYHMMLNWNKKYLISILDSY